MTSFFSPVCLFSTGRFRFALADDTFLHFQTKYEFVAQGLITLNIFLSPVVVIKEKERISSCVILNYLIFDLPSSAILGVLL